MIIKDVIVSKSRSGFYYDDQKAIKGGQLERDGFFYHGNPLTAGFEHIRHAGEAISLQIILDDGTIGLGDCVAVQYSGIDGRDPLFLAKDYYELIIEEVLPILKGHQIISFRQSAEYFDNLLINEKRLHTAIRYGLTQALLSAVSNYKKTTMVEIIRGDYNLESLELKRVPIFTQSGDDRYLKVDQMIIKEVDVLPHALINNVETKLGHQGEILKEYLEWVVNRINTKKRRQEYQPVIQLDVYGTFGEAFSKDLDKIANYIIDLEKIALPYLLRIEGPVDFESRENTMKALQVLTSKLKARKSKVDLVADEWCNSLEDIKYFVDNRACDMVQIKAPDLGGINNAIEAILYCNKHGIKSYLGGSCNETDISTRVSANIALACEAKLLLGKPGMGVDEGLMILENEQQRIIALSKILSTR